MINHMGARLLCIASVLALALSAACSGAGDVEDRPVGTPCHGKIASFFPLTGPSAAVGVSGNNGAVLAVDQFRAAHPDCVVEFLVKDSPQVSPSKAVDIARELAQDPSVIGVVGPAYSADATVADHELSQAGLTFVIPTAILPDLSEHGDVTFHRIVGNSATQGPAVVRYLANSLHARKVFLVDDETTVFTKDIVRAIREESPVVGNATFRSGATDFSAIVDQIVASGADAVFVGGFYAEAGLLVSQLRKAGSTATFLTDSGALTDAFLSTAGPAAEGAVIFSSATPPTKVPDSFINDYRGAFGTAPDYFAAEGFDATNILLAGIRAGHTTRAAMEGFVDAYDSEGLTGKIKFTEAGELDPYLVSVWAYKVENGEIIGDQEMYASPRR